MTDLEILKMAIDKAIKGGYDPSPDWVYEHHFGEFTIHGELIQPNYNLIFSHEFAKAFWGEEFRNCRNITYKYGGVTETRLLKAWQYQLQQMVLEEKPLKYLENFLTIELSDDRRR